MRSESCIQTAAVNIHWVDATILCSYLLGMVVFGMWMGRGIRSSAEFMVGGRSMPWWAVLCSIVATETSTITFLSVPGVAYTGDLGFLQLPLGYILGRWIVASKLLPRYSQLRRVHGRWAQHAVVGCAVFDRRD